MRQGSVPCEMPVGDLGHQGGLRRGHGAAPRPCPSCAAARRRSRRPRRAATGAARSPAAPTPTPTISATCWCQGVAPTTWPVLRSCRLSLAIEAVVTMTDVSSSAMPVTNRSPSGPGGMAEEQRQQQRGRHGGEDADPGDRARRGAEQAREVAAGGGHQEAEQDREQRRGDRQHDHQAAELGGWREDGEQRSPSGTHRRQRRAGDPGDRQVALLARVVACRGRRCRDRARADARRGSGGPASPPSTGRPPR